MQVFVVLCSGGYMTGDESKPVIQATAVVGVYGTQKRADEVRDQWKPEWQWLQSGGGPKVWVDMAEMDAAPVFGGTQ